MNPYVQLLRVGNCMMGIVAVILGAVVLLGDIGLLEEYWLQLIFASIVVFAFTGAGNALNDYYDRDIDKVNHPKRPIPAGKVSPKATLAFAGLLFVIAINLSLFVSFYCLVIVLVNLAIMVSYEAFSKSRGFIGNLTISWLTGTLFIFGAFAIWDGQDLTAIWILATLAFFATLGREITKDIQDMKGDVGRKTLPKSVGRRKARYAASAAFAVAILLSPLPYLFAGFGIWYLAIVLLADITFIYAAFILRKRARKASGYAKYAMFIALIAFLFGGIV